MKEYHDASIDYLSLSLRDEVEAKSVYEDGAIVRYDGEERVIGVDITDSVKFFANSELVAFVCESLGVSEPTLRGKCRAGSEVAPSAGM